MAQREKAKEANREKIKTAAERIIREEGMEKLTMRRLAEAAEVSLRTPYNLFGSKTAVLIALFDDANEQLAVSVLEEEDAPALERLFRSLDDFARLYAKDEAFYREVFFGIMTSDQIEDRRPGYDRLILLVQTLLAQAVAAKELDADPEELGEHFAILFMSVLGMWAAGFFNTETFLDHVRRSWAAQLPEAAQPPASASHLRGAPKTSRRSKPSKGR